MKLCKPIVYYLCMLFCFLSDFSKLVNTVAILLQIPLLSLEVSNLTWFLDIESSRLDDEILIKRNNQILTKFKLHVPLDRLL